MSGIVRQELFGGACAERRIRPLQGPELLEVARAVDDGDHFNERPGQLVDNAIVLIEALAKSVLAVLRNDSAYAGVPLEFLDQAENLLREEAGVLLGVSRDVFADAVEVRQGLGRPS